MKRHDHVVFVREGRDALGRRHGGRCRDHRHAQRFGHVESAIDLLIGETVVEAEVERAEIDSGVVEFLPNGLDLVERHRQAPLAQIVARHAFRLDVRRKQLAFAQPDLGHRLDHAVQRLFAEAVALRADQDAADGRVDLLLRQQSSTLAARLTAILPKSRRVYIQGDSYPSPVRTGRGRASLSRTRAAHSPACRSAANSRS